MIGARSGQRSLSHDAHDAADLARRIHAGDRDAEAELSARYRAGITMVLRNLVKDSALSDDLAQEVFRIALESLRKNRLKDAARLSAYLWGIARNLASAARRYQHRHPEIALDDTLVDTTALQDHQLLQEERARLVQDALKGLSPRDREVLREYYLNDAPKEAICHRLGLTPAQFDVIKFRALKRMRPLLGMGENDHD